MMGNLEALCPPGTLNSTSSTSINQFSPPPQSTAPPPTQLTYTMSGLNNGEKHIFCVAHFEASWNAGIAIAESSCTRKENIYVEIIMNYRPIVQSLDFEELDNFK